ncbi:MAG TPA: SPFH domain-containing protein [Verrucomicrobiae bacterium]|nr:SPFH domain-containing protein [Verrucomicrobiae bacterium]
MERNVQKNGLVNLVISLIAGVAAFIVARYTNSLAGIVSVLFLALGTLVAAVSWFQMRLEQSEKLEKLEFDELARTHGDSALFESRDAEVFPAQRSREQFERFFVPIFTVILCLAEAGGAYFFWKWLSGSTISTNLKQPMAGMFIFFVTALVLFLLGRFSSTYARLENQRLLRPSASYLLLNAFLCAIVGAGIIAVQARFGRADLYVARVMCGLLALMAIETLVALVLEIYRPRVKGKVSRPLYDGRLVGLLGQPEGLITTAAQAIDYQFGFKVSETWFYRFFERALVWLLPLQVLLLVLSTGMVVVEPGEQALLEHFGKPAEGRPVLGPGPHLKWPWPIDRIYRFRTEQIQSFEVGASEDQENENERAVLWTVAHTKKDEENFLVANHEPADVGVTNQVGGKRTPPVSLITGSIPVLYQITNVEHWAYNNEDAPSLLQDLGTREIVRFLAGVDLSELMSAGRLEASQELARRIQAAADSHGLGARVIEVGLQDVHPPVKVAPDYEKVVAATQLAEAKILGARADEIKTNALSVAQATTVVDAAESDAVSKRVGAMAKAGLFTNQIPAFQAAPSVYVRRAYLNAFARSTASARKYLMLTTNTHDVIVFDLQESIARDLLNMKVPSPNQK